MATTKIDTHSAIPTTRRRAIGSVQGAVNGGRSRAALCQPDASLPHSTDDKRREYRRHDSSHRRLQQITRTAARRWTVRAPQRLASNYIRRRIDSAWPMITILVAVMVVISQNVVNAVQRDAYKHKDPKGIGIANAIQGGGGISGTVNGYGSYIVGSDGNGNVASSSSRSGGGYTNTISNGNTISSSLKGNSAATIIATRGGSVGGVGTVGAYVNATATATTTATASTTQRDGSNGSGMGTSVANRNSNEVLEDQRSGPYFDRAASKNVTALLGKTAYLNCRVKNLGNKTMLLQVSWVRHRDIHLLTVGRYTYTSDQRFRAIHQPQTEDWILQIKYPQHRDSGTYECQVSTTPHMSHYIQLSVIEPSTEIVGAPDLYIESGSTINLTCVILNSPEPPAYIFWNHNEAIINYDSPRGGVSVVTIKGEITTSFLLIKSARPSDSGQYQCNPSNAKSKSVTVHVLNGEFPAAMQRAGQAHHRMSQSLYLLVYLSVYLFTLAYVKQYMRFPAAAAAPPPPPPPAAVAGGADIVM